MLEKIIRFFNEHPIRFFVRIFLGLLVVPTAFIHIVYVVPTESWWSQETISAGSMLSYIGTVLTFCVTFMLSLLVYHSNIEERKRSRLLEEKALLVENRTLLSIDKKQIIKVDCKYLYYSKKALKLQVALSSSASFYAWTLSCFCMNLYFILFMHSSQR